MATIIKRGEQTPTPAGESVRGVAYDLEEMSGYGDDYVARVRQEAAKIVQQANSEADQIRQRAESEGRKAAEQAIDRILGNKLSEQMQTLRPAIERVVAGLDEARGEWLTHWERAAVRLAGQMAERITRREIAEHPSVTVEWAREALALVAGASEVTVRLNEADHANLGDQVAAVAEAIGKAGRADVLADPDVSPGGCVVETRHGVIDSQIESQLARLMEDLH